MDEFTKEKTELLRKEEYNIEKVTHLTIGDPDYFESGRPNELALTFNKSIRNNFLCAMDISEEKHTWEFKGQPFDHTSIVVDIYCIGTQINKATKEQETALLKDKTFLEEKVIPYTNKTLQVYRDGGYWAKNGEPKEKGLACDCAEFIIEVNKKSYDDFHTGADGYYGSVMDYNHNSGMKFTLSFDGDLFTFEDIKKRMDNLFHIKEKTNEFILDDKEEDLDR